jgi:hypothetical protein
MTTARKAQVTIASRMTVTVPTMSERPAGRPGIREASHMWRFTRLMA